MGKSPNKSLKGACRGWGSLMENKMEEIKIPLHLRLIAILFFPIHYTGWMMWNKNWDNWEEFKAESKIWFQLSTKGYI